MNPGGRKGARLRVAFTAAWAAAAAGLWHFQTRPIVDAESFRWAMENSSATGSFQDDGIAFLEGRLRSRMGNDDLARSRLIGLYLGRFKLSGNPDDLDAARDHLDSLLRRDPGDERLYIKLSSLELTEHRFGPALEAAEKAAALSARGNDSHDAAILAVSDALFAIGRYGDARRRLENGLKDTVSFAALTHRARLDGWLGKREAAEAEMETACKDALAGAAAPTVLAWCAVELADLADRGGKPAKAMTGLREALSLVPGYAPALEGLGRLAYGRDHDLRKAKSLWEKALRNGGHLSLYLDLIRIEMESGNGSGARSLKDRFVTEATATPILEWMYLRSLAMAEMDSSSSSSAQAALRYALLDNGNRQTAESYDVLAWAYFRSGSIVNAYHASRQALERDARDPSRLYRAALIAWHAGNRAQADTLMRQAVESAKTLRKRGETVSGFPPALAVLGNEFGRSLNARDLLAFHTHD